MHYIRQGKYENRKPIPKDVFISSNDKKQLLNAYSEEERRIIEDNFLLDRTRKSSGEIVDVIMPVYKNRILTINCIYSVLSSCNKNKLNLIIINDKSPEERLCEKLKYLNDKGCIQLISNQENKGFVYSVNRGIQINKNRNVVILNSDTRVYSDWLDRLLKHNEKQNIGTITPLSNDATICSYPKFLQRNSENLEVDFAIIDALTKKVNNGASVESPTGVGFCMFINRKCLNEIGYFDYKSFGKGYGEENDFCQRAKINGWKNLLAADIFVWHYGGASFGYRKNERIKSAMKIIKERYINYDEDVKDFIRQDPLSTFRENLDTARINWAARKENVLFISHNRGGGSEKFLLEDVRREKNKGRGIFYIRPGSGSKIKFSHLSNGFLPNSNEHVLDDMLDHYNLFRKYNIKEIHIHSTVDFDQNIVDIVAHWKEKINTILKIYIHDYTFICPKINLVNSKSEFCHEPREEICNICIKKGSQFPNVKNISSWRKRNSTLLMAADKVIVPNIDVYARLDKYFPACNLVLQPHELNSIKKVERYKIQLKGNKKIKVAVIGSIGIIKGYNCLLRAAILTRKKKLPIEFTLMGFSVNDKRLLKNNVLVTGKYNDDDAQKFLKLLKPDVIWLPSIWPETYSYTLSIVFRSGMPVIAFDLGAIASRVIESSYDGLLMPISKANDAKYICTSIIDFMSEKEPIKSV